MRCPVSTMSQSLVKGRVPCSWSNKDGECLNPRANNKYLAVCRTKWAEFLRWGPKKSIMNSG
jgi:hypothetical protein